MYERSGVLGGQVAGLVDLPGYGSNNMVTTPYGTGGFIEAVDGGSIGVTSVNSEVDSLSFMIDTVHA